MTLQVIIMFAVAGTLTLVGAGLLLSLIRPSGPAKVYVFRMVGVMALAAAFVLALGAAAMWQWSLEP